MKRGYFSGFTQHFATEDFAIFLSQGPRLDRTREQLCSSDTALVRLRQQLLRSVKEFMAGQQPSLGRHPELAYRDIVSFGGVYPPDDSWRSLASERGDTGLAGHAPSP